MPRMPNSVDFSHRGSWVITTEKVRREAQLVRRLSTAQSKPRKDNNCPRSFVTAPISRRARPKRRFKTHSSSFLKNFGPGIFGEGW